MDFVALDFETANHQRESVCEIGIALVQGGMLKEQRSWLVRPRDNWFNSMNTRIHGIDAQKVADAPEFDELWHSVLLPYFDQAFVVAHNASFDLSVLRHVLAQYGIPFPELRYTCSLQVARRAWRGYDSYGLGSLSERFGIALRHHAAGSDAEACARILLRAMEEHQLSHIEDIESAFGLQLGSLYPNGYSPAGRMRPRKKKKPALQDMKIDLSKVHHEHPLYGKQVVFTGTLKSMSRAEAQKKVLEAGGIAPSYVNNQTHYLVLSEKIFLNLSKGLHNNKVREASQLRERGSQTRLISESDFLQMLAYEIPGESQL
ncbi:MAG: exonuclease domain-containing protein [Cyclobacteriaceae bacterium]